MFGADSGSDENAFVSVVVVTHNNDELIGHCLEAVIESVRRYRSQIIVVDNASTDRTLQRIEEGNWAVDAIKLKENLGFAKAVDRAWERAEGRYVALVNSDAFPDPGCIDALIDVLEHSSRVGLVGARLRYPSGLLQPSAGTFPSLLGGLWVALFLHRLPGASRLGIGYLADERLYRRPREVDWVSAAVCAARAEVGPLPVSSFMYGEDVEWASECRNAGWEVRLEPAAAAIHVGRASVDKSQNTGFAQRQRVQFELEWFAPRGPIVQLIARFVLLVHALLRLAIYGGLAVLRGRGDRRVAEYATLLRAALSTHLELR